MQCTGTHTHKQSHSRLAPIAVIYLFLAHAYLCVCVCVCHRTKWNNIGCNCAIFLSSYIGGSFKMICSHSTLSILNSMHFLWVVTNRKHVQANSTQAQELTFRKNATEREKNVNKIERAQSYRWKSVRCAEKKENGKDDESESIE